MLTETLVVQFRYSVLHEVWLRVVYIWLGGSHAHGMVVHIVHIMHRTQKFSDSSSRLHWMISGRTSISAQVRKFESLCGWRQGSKSVSCRILCLFRGALGLASPLHRICKYASSRQSSQMETPHIRDGARPILFVFVQVVIFGAFPLKPFSQASFVAIGRRS